MKLGIIIFALSLINGGGISRIISGGALYRLTVKAPEAKYMEDSVILGSPVSFYGPGITGQAWEGVYFIRERKVHLQGGVWLKTRGEVLSGDECVLDLKNGVITIKNGEVILRKPGYKGKVTGEEITAKKNREYFLKNAMYTTCQCAVDEIPAWRVKFSSANLERDGYLKVKNASFQILDIPVLFFPYLVLPSKVNRQSGFLTPQFEYYTKKGFYASLGYYQVLSEWSDLTFDVDYYEKRGIGGGVNLRYALPYGGGNHYFYYINEFVGPLNSRFWFFRINHRQRVPQYKLRLMGYGRYYSDTEHLKEYSQYVQTVYSSHTKLGFFVEEHLDKVPFYLSYERYQPVMLYAKELNTLFARMRTQPLNFLKYFDFYMDTGAYVYGEVMEKYGIYARPVLSFSTRKWFYVNATVNGIGTYFNTNNMEDFKGKTGWNGSFKIGIPLLALFSENSAHRMIFEGGGEYFEHWREVPYGINTGAYYFFNTVRSRDLFLATEHTLGVWKILSISARYRHYWLWNAYSPEKKEYVQYE